MDRQRLADALAYEQERRRRLANVVPVPASGQPEVAPTPSLRSNLENLSIGLGEGLTNQLEGVRALVTDPIGSAKGAYEGVVAAVRDPSIIADALRYTAQQAASGPLGAGEVIGEMVGPMRTRGTPVMQEIDVYHGSPHRFPPTENNPLGEFDASKIGTGEGAQAYGHGSYLAESPDVAKIYALMDSPFAAAGLKGPAATVAALAKIDGKGNPVKFLEDNYDAQVKQFGKQEVDSAIAGLKRGNLYTADLPDEMVDRMLDWDKPLSQQSTHVKTSLKNLGIDSEGLSLSSGADLIRKDLPLLFGHKMRAAGFNPNKSSDVSAFLKSQGIPGIKYADAGSRGQGGSGTRNFVVFPGEEKKVKILKRD